MKEKSGFKILAWVMLVLMSVNIALLLSVSQTVESVLQHTKVQKASMMSQWKSGIVQHTYTTYLGEDDPSEVYSAHSRRHLREMTDLLTLFPKTEKPK